MRRYFDTQLIFETLTIDNDDDDDWIVLFMFQFVDIWNQSAE